MDWDSHRQRLIAHCLWLRTAADQEYAKAATARYARLPHLQGLEEEVEEAWKLHVGPPKPP